MAARKLLCLFAATLAYGAAILTAPAQEPDFAAAAKRVTVYKLQGNSANNQNYQASWQKINNSTADVLKNIYNICGLKLPDGKKVVVNFKDTAGNAKPGSIVYAITYPEGYGSSMDYSIPTVMSRSQNPLHIYQHEMTHALQESIMGNDAYWNGNLLHDWIREGLATYVGGHGPERLVRFKSLGAKMINGLESHTGPSDYAEDYLAFVYMESKWGKDGVKSFVRDVTYNRVPWRKAIKNLSGMDWAAFTEDCRKFSIAYIDPNSGKPPVQVAKNDPPKTDPPKTQAPPPVTNPTRPEPPSNPRLNTPIQQPVIRNTPPAPVASGKPFFGAHLKDLDEETARTFNLPMGQGVMILAVLSDSPADKVGIEAGDIVLEFNGHVAESADKMQHEISAFKPGAAVPVKVSRDGQTMMLNVTIGAQ